MDPQPIEPILRRLAAHTVRRQCNQHDCTAAARMPTTCDHPNHRRDADLVAHCLNALGLADAPVVTTPDELQNLRDTLRNSGPPPAVDLGQLLLNGLQDR